MYVCIHACMHVCMHACMHACMHVCMYVYTCISDCLLTILLFLTVKFVLMLTKMYSGKTADRRGRRNVQQLVSSRLVCSANTRKKSGIWDSEIINHFPDY